MTAAEIRQSFLDFFREKQHSVVPSASLLPDSPNLLFTNAGMNQFVPIFLGQQKPSWDPPRVADTQKCIRAGGKHNDLDDVGLDTYHHTFFEMLGNWSFGDYFKKEAIEWAWELVVGRWKLPASRLYATVYKPGPGEPSEFDQEAHDYWATLFEKAGLDPAVHVVNGNKKDNFWMMGDTGPCGPCSELHVDLTPAGDTKGSLVNAGDARCIEIWNLVFIQFNANADATFSPLPQRHVDTGLGLERITAMIQGTKNFTDFTGIISNYETNVFRPIFDELEKLSGKKYTSTLPDSSDRGAHAPSRAGVGASPTASGEAPDATPEAGVLPRAEQEKIDIAFRVIADHIRTLSFAIADGIQPSNEGRGYVLRRILRRAVRYGRTLGFQQPFFYLLVDVLANTMGDVFPELRNKHKLIKDTLRREEEGFNKTLDKGIEVFTTATFCVPPEDNRNLGSITATGAQENAEFMTTLEGRMITGEFAFKLYDTYGFPLDLTELMGRERGLSVDVAGFERLMDEQRERARKSQKKQAIELEDGKLDVAPTKFLGYDFPEMEAVVEAVLAGRAPNEFNIVLDRTPCYAEMGGQVGDHGLLHVPGHDQSEVGQLAIFDTRKRGDVFVHVSRLMEGRAPEPGEAVRVSVDAARRDPIQGHHTVTHVLHWALHEKVSKEAVQKGSYVGPEKLTFDFSSAALTGEQKREVERLVNEKIAENAPVSWTEIPYAEAKKRSDIQQFFGDKYGEKVRVVQIGGEPKQLNGYSMELCGGTHVRATGDIGSFRIVREEAIAAGIRRIEAVAGEAAKNWAREEAVRQQEKFGALERKKSGIAALPAFSDNAETATMLQQIDARAAHLEKLEAEVSEWQKQQSKASEADVKSRAAAIAKELRAAHATDKAIVASVADADGKLLQGVVDALKSHFGGPIFLAGALDGRVALVASVPKELTTQFQANKLIQEIAPIVGGKGGGRPDNAQGAGKDTAKIDAALARARELLL
ncbi:MAG: alanine--tRNA ligase [Verrucomicrobia bacterium]|nr:MAG: alanine--tRNA ligase [Verrucomicrobiota bacterium]